MLLISYGYIFKKQSFRKPKGRKIYPRQMLIKIRASETFSDKRDFQKSIKRGQGGYHIWIKGKMHLK